VDERDKVEDFGGGMASAVPLEPGREVGFQPLEADGHAERGTE
jgi:hypothetical protein